MNTPTLTLQERVAEIHKHFMGMHEAHCYNNHRDPNGESSKYTEMSSTISTLQSALKQRDDVLDKTKNVLKPFCPGTIHKWNPDGNNKGNIEISYDTYNALCDLYNTIAALKE